MVILAQKQFLWDFKSDEKAPHVLYLTFKIIIYKGEQMDTLNNQQHTAKEEKEIHVGITLPAGIHHKAKILALIEGLSLSKFVRHIIIEKINSTTMKGIDLKFM